jgi:hypothetical protein
MKAIIALTMFCFLSFAHAAENQAMPFLISGVLKRNNTESTVKVVQGIVLSSSSEKASSEFRNAAQAQFPDYTVIDVLANRVDELYKPPQNGLNVPQVTAPTKRQHLISI